MNEQAICSSTGWAIGWLVGNAIYDFSGQPRAFLEDAGVFSFEADHLGEFYDGYFRDHAGDAVAFVEGARDGPPLPSDRHSAPELPELKDLPTQPAIPTTPAPCPGTQRWSENPWNSDLHGWRPYRIADR